MGHQDEAASPSGKAEVCKISIPSSNLGAASKFKIKYAFLAQLDRVSDYESEGQGFESLRARHIKE